MKIIRLLIFISVICSIRVSAQSLEPSKTHAVIYMLIVDESDKPITEKVELVSKKTGEKFKGISNINGMVELKVPINDIYILNMTKVKEYDVFNIPAEPFYSLDYKIKYKADMYLTLGMSLIKLKVLTNSGMPLPEEKVTFMNLTTQAKISKTTDLKGNLSVELPNNANYNISFVGAPDYERFHLPKAENNILDFQLEFDGSGNGKHYPTMESGLLIFSYVDLDDNPVPNERFEIVSKKEKKSYSVKTNQEGQAYLLVPLGDKYSFSSVYFHNFQEFVFPDNLGLHQTKVKLKAISSVEFELRKKMREELLRLRDSAYLAREGLLQLLDHALLTIEKEESRMQYKLKQIETKAIEAKQELEKSPTYFEKVKNTVNAILYRQRNNWGDKIIITDVTCSMDLYLEEVFLWHALKLNPNNKNEYIFFNDGDGKLQHQKIVGETGGFHYTNSVLLDSIVLKGWYAKSFGCSGDGPENDFEAILNGIEYRDSRKEIILVADNYSDVRDYSLLEEINIPVRIILCGLDNHVNEQYLNLAYHTKGSIHSIEKDLDMLKRVTYGSKIVFLGKTYIYTEGGFVFKN